MRINRIQVFEPDAKDYGLLLQWDSADKQGRTVTESVRLESPVGHNRRQVVFVMERELAERLFPDGVFDEHP